MSERMHALAQQIFGKPSVEQCELQEIKDLVQRYPYFAPAQFLLLEKLKLEQSPEYNTQLQKAVLMYHNPLEFEYFISSDKFNTELDLNAGQTEYAPIDHQEVMTGEETEFIPEVTNTPDETISIQLEEPVESDAEYAAGAMDGEMDTKIIQEEAVNNLVPDQQIMESFSAETQDDLSAGPLVETEEESGHQEFRDSNETAERVMEETENEPWTPGKETITGETDIQQEEPENQTLETTPPVSEPSLLRSPLQSNEVKESTSPMTFEPFHTVDYFASQGIRLSQEEIPKDKFGKQLKSFTEWLKTMKRLPATEITAVVDPASESSVVHLAEDSVHDPNIVTEAMAEVWLKQGNRAKALEVYNKLSLLNPSKRAYFAGLIENLKRS